VQSARLGSVLVLAVALQGCSQTAGAPAVPIFGSYFPAWIICAVGGILVAVALRFLFAALQLEEYLPAPPLVYLCLAISAGIGIWLVWAGQI